MQEALPDVRVPKSHHNRRGKMLPITSRTRKGATNTRQPTVFEIDPHSGRNKHASLATPNPILKAPNQNHGTNPRDQTQLAYDFRPNPKISAE